jgi:hypothetical protein
MGAKRGGVDISTSGSVPDRNDPLRRRALKVVNVVSTVGTVLPITPPLPLPLSLPLPLPLPLPSVVPVAGAAEGLGVAGPP